MARFENNERSSNPSIVRDREVDHRIAPAVRKPLHLYERATRNRRDGLTRLRGKNLDVRPKYLFDDAGAECLQERLLRSEPTGVEQVRLRLGLSEGLLGLRERPVEEALSVSPDHAGHALDEAEIVADAEDHQREPL
jgi:hypothetical protein